jgi:DNA adenine methylase
MKTNQGMRSPPGSEHPELEHEGLLSEDTNLRQARPFLKWAGGKGQLITRLLPLVPKGFINYYEPFLGGGALFFALHRHGFKFKASLTDRNTELINCYRIVKNRPEELIEFLDRLKRQHYNAPDKEEHYYNIRKWKPTNALESASRFIFLNKTCYNGLYRVNKDNEFNVPFGGYKRPAIFDNRNIMAASSALRETQAELYSEDYSYTLDNCARPDFVYFDPPYFPTSKTAAFTDYTVNGFGEEDQVKLADSFSNLVLRGCSVLLTNSDTPLVRRLYGV